MTELMELTQDRKAAVQESWGLVRQNMRKNGADFYLHFFTMYPVYKDLFKDLRDTPLAELASHPKLKAHGLRAFYAIASMVDSLDDVDITAQIMAKTAADHYPRGIRQQQFIHVFDALLDFLRVRLGEAFDSRVRDGWRAIIATLLIVTERRLKELEDNA